MFDGIANVRMAREWLTESARQETAPRDSELVMQYWRPEKNPLLIRNDSETARKILALKLPELQKGNGVQLGFEAITWHLRQARAAKPIVSVSKT